MSAGCTPSSSSSSSQIMSREEQGHDDDIEKQVIREEPDGNSRATDDDASFPTINKVRGHWCAPDDGIYEPCHVSIGPYHRGSSRSHLWREDDKQKSLEKLKLKSKAFAANEGQPEHGQSLFGTEEAHAVLVKEISKWLNNYDAYGSWGGRREELADMLLFDGYYLVDRYVNVWEMLQKKENHTEHTPGSNKQAASASGSTQHAPGSNKVSSVACGSTQHALMVRDSWYILQNQIPFFVLEKILHRVTGCASEEARREFTIYAHRLLHTQRMCISIQHKDASKLQMKPRQTTTTFHLLHLLNTLLKPHQPPAESESNKTKSNSGDDDKKAEGQWRRASEYRMYANVEFEGRDIADKNSASVDVLSVLDVRIEGRRGNVVMVPRLRVDGNTWTILLNLMALEGQHPLLVGTHVTAYCLFMSQIACTKEDVELLVAQGVIDNHLGAPENVAADFSKLCKGVVLDRSDITANYLKPFWHHLDKRYTSRQQNIAAWLCLNYFNWRKATVLLGVFSAFILLGAGVLSAVYQVLSYYHPQSIAPAPPHGH